MLKSHGQPSHYAVLLEARRSRRYNTSFIGRRLAADGYGVPVLEAAQCAVTLTELYARMGLSQSRQTYMPPPKK